MQGETVFTFWPPRRDWDPAFPSTWSMARAGVAKVYVLARGKAGRTAAERIER